MFFTCNECKYTFVSEKTPERCPDCGKIAVRKATEEEIEEYKQYRLLFDREDGGDSHDGYQLVSSGRRNKKGAVASEDFRGKENFPTKV